MEVIIGSGYVEVYPTDSSTSASTVINGRCIIRIEPIPGESYQPGKGTPDPDLPYEGEPYQDTPQWSVILVQNDRQIQKIPMGGVDNQAGWTNDLAGAQQAVDDLTAALNSGGVIYDGRTRSYIQSFVGTTDAGGHLKVDLTAEGISEANFISGSAGDSANGVAIAAPEDITLATYTVYYEKPSGAPYALFPVIMTLAVNH